MAASPWTPSTPTLRPLRSRKTDLVYSIFFLTHVPVIFLIDAVSLFPPSFRTEFSLRLREFYVDNFHDKFFEGPQPIWFTVFIWMELLYHAPLSIWAVFALWRDDPLVPLHLLPWAVQAFVTSLTCLVDVWSWTDRTVEEKTNITMLYAPYVALGAFVAIDMFYRLRDRLIRKTKRE